MDPIVKREVIQARGAAWKLRLGISPCHNEHTLKWQRWAGVVAQSIRALVIRAEDLDSVSSKHGVSLPSVIPGPGDLVIASYGLLGHQTCPWSTYTHAGQIHIH